MTKEEFLELKTIQDKIAKKEHKLILINSIIGNSGYCITVSGMAYFPNTVKRDIVIANDESAQRLLTEEKNIIESELAELRKEFETYSVSKA